MIRADCPTLRKKVKGPKSRDSGNTILKDLPWRHPHDGGSTEAHARWRQSLSAICWATSATAGRCLPVTRATRGIWRWRGRRHSTTRKAARCPRPPSKTPAPLKLPTQQARWSGGNPAALIAASITRSMGDIRFERRDHRRGEKRPTRSAASAMPAPAAAASPPRRK